jgi:hypothetical protein
MKLRTGFVSNSSSSSFVLKRGVPFNTPLEVAYHMIMERNWPSDQDLLDKLMEMARDKEIDKNTNLCFSSTNYDTYIWVEEPDGDHQPESRIGIYTCNNIDWGFPDGVEYDGDDNGYELSLGKTFTMIKSGLKGKRLDESTSKQITEDTGINGWDTWCNTCATDGWVVSQGSWKKVICPKCQTILFKRLASGGKWEKI